jgi:uncharacterized protein (UPF0276 family)
MSDVGETRRDADALSSLPVLGVGASLSLSAEPDPVALVEAPGGPQFVEYAGRVDVDEVKAEVERVRNTGAAVLFHPSYINFCGSYANSPAWLEETARHIAEVGSPWFAQDLAYCFVNDGYGYSSQLGYFVPPVLNEASLARAIERVREVQRVVRVPVAIEPPPMTYVAGRMPLFTYFGRLARETDCALLLDVGHLVSYEMGSGRKVLDALSDLPTERVIEVHIAGGRIDDTEHAGVRRRVYVDAHERDILPEAYAMLEALLPHLSALRAVCFECEGRTQGHVLDTLSRLRTLVRDKSPHRALVAALGDAA